MVTRLKRLFLRSWQCLKNTSKKTPEQPIIDDSEKDLAKFFNQRTEFFFGKNGPVYLRKTPTEQEEND